jgi:hypothetical protein
VAPKGSGKTTRIAELVRVTPRVAIFDPMAETDFQYRRVASHIVTRDLQEAHLVLAEDNFRLLYEPQLPTQEGEEWFYADFRPFLAKCWRRVQLIGPMMLVVDEAHYTMSARTMPVEMWNIVTNGRRYGLDVVWITQRFVGVNGWVRANADEYWFARLVHPADLQTVAAICGPEVMDRVRNLRRLDANSVPIVPGQLLIWNSLDGSVILEEQSAIQSTAVPESSLRDGVEHVDGGEQAGGDVERSRSRDAVRKLSEPKVGTIAPDTPRGIAQD